MPELIYNSAEREKDIKDDLVLRRDIPNIIPELVWSVFFSGENFDKDITDAINSIPSWITCEDLDILLDDFGRAKCDKYDLIVDFAHEGKLKKLKCVEHQGTKGGEMG